MDTAQARRILATHRFDAASDSERIVFGSARPGYPSNEVPDALVAEWMEALKHQGIRRICCLLEKRQLLYYSDLAEDYRRAFGAGRVLMAEVRDYRLAEPSLLTGRILPFLSEAAGADERCLVHCSGGYGRTGHVLAVWLVAHRGLSPVQAIATVKSHGRSPAEALSGDEDALAAWLEDFMPAR